MFFFLQLSNIPLCTCITVFLSIHLPMDSCFKFPVWSLQQPCLLSLCLIQLCCLPFNIPIIFFSFLQKGVVVYFWPGLHGCMRACSGWGFSLWGFSCCAEQAVGTGASVAVMWLSGCCTQALERWIFPWPGIKLVSLASQGRFLAPGPPGKP